MDREFKSIEERKKQFLEDCCGMVAGDGGFTNESPAEGPTAGYDPLMKTLKMLKRKKKKK